MLLTLLPWQAAGQDLPLARNPIRVALVDPGLHQDGQYRIGLHIRLALGWKFYWRTPGEGGVPPRFDWSGSENLATADIRWPAPRRIAMGDADLYGYTGEVVLPVTVAAMEPEDPVRLHLRLEYGICKEICILREENLTRVLEPGADLDAAKAVMLERWEARVPRRAADSGFRLVSSKITANKLIVTIEGAAPLDAPDLLVEAAPEAWFGRPKTRLSPDRRQAQFTIPVSPPDVDGPLMLTLIDAGLAVELMADP